MCSVGINSLDSRLSHNIIRMPKDGHKLEDCESPEILQGLDENIILPVNTGLRVKIFG